MARKRTVKQTKKAADVPVVQFKPSRDVTPLTNADGARIQEMADLSNTFSSIIKQQQQYDSAIYMLKLKRDQVAKGIIKLPVMIQITRTVSHAESDKDKVLKHFDDEIANIEMAKRGLDGSLNHRRDEYVECVLRVQKMLESKVKGHEIKKIIGVRPGSHNIEEEEKKALEKELNAALEEK